MKKLCCMIALAAISFGSVYGETGTPKMHADTTRKMMKKEKKMQKDSIKMMKKEKKKMQKDSIRTVKKSMKRSTKRSMKTDSVKM